LRRAERTRTLPPRTRERSTSDNLLSRCGLVRNHAPPRINKRNANAVRLEKRRRRPTRSARGALLAPPHDRPIHHLAGFPRATVAIIKTRSGRDHFPECCQNRL